MENYNKELENKLLEVVKEKERADKHLLSLEIVIGVICTVILLGLAMFASFLELEEWLRVVLILVGLVPFLILLPFLIKIEQTAGYYECKECGHKYVPTFKSVFWSAHMGRTRHMRCPNCHKKTWQKKRISKD